MKNGKKVAVAAVIAVVFLAACGSKTDEAVASGEIVVPEMSSEDLLVSSLEYLLLDDTQDGQQDSQEQANTQNDLKEPGDTADADIGQEPDEVQGDTVTIYYGNGGSSDLTEETIILPEKTPDELIGALSKHNIVSLDTKVLSFEEGKEGDTTVLYLDLSRAAGEYLRTMSKEAECIIIASVANTFLENYDADAVYLMVEGKTLTTSHAEYTQALGRCTPDEVLKISGEADADASQEHDAADTDEADYGKVSADEVESKLPLIQEKE